MRKTPASQQNEKSSHSVDGENTGEADAEGESKDDSDWRKEAKTEAAAYGLGEKELAEFQSREELDRALKLFDGRFEAEREKLAAETGKNKEGETQEKASGQSDAPSGKSDAPSGKSDGKYEVRLDPDVYDDEIVAEFTSLRDHYDSHLEEMRGAVAALEQRFVDAEMHAAEQQFDQSVDALEFSQLFGKTGSESADEMSRRGDLFEAVQIEQEIMSRLGKNVSYDTLVQRALRSTFPDEYDKRLLKNHTRKLSRQSDSRQGGGATRPTDPPEDPREYADRLFRELEGV